MPFVVTTWPDGSVVINGECILREGVPVPDDPDDDERLVKWNGKRLLGMRSTKRKGEKDKPQHQRVSHDPNWKWTMMRETSELLAEHSRLVTFCNPPNLGIKVEPLEGKATATRWNWKERIASYREDHAETNILGGWYNMKMQPDDRKQRSINMEDPLQHYYPHAMKGLLKGEIELDRHRICRVNCGTCAKQYAEHAAWMEELRATRLM
ncbi:hypothetical protein AC579_6038 [Pseudocercospora musae]|uniref:Uncharacterized protein n=1 Tax=Pseudocercospora musae TaxID=113226 RepID=A0A139IF83_9PEZI|nr:hypothetical protein AC579_6038 [Pseudocercospora musae]